MKASDALLCLSNADKMYLPIALGETFKVIGTKCVNRPFDLNTGVRCDNKRVIDEYAKKVSFVINVAEK